MKLKVKLELDQVESDFLNTDQALFYYMEADSSNAEDDEFNVSNLDIKKFRVTYAERNTFSIDIFDYIKRSKENCSFIHLFCYLASSNPRTLPVPKRFKLQVNSDEEISFSVSEGDTIEHGDPSWVTLGKMSQFTLSNVAEFGCDLLVSNFEMDSADTVNFIIVVGLKD